MPIASQISRSLFAEPAVRDSDHGSRASYHNTKAVFPLPCGSLSLSFSFLQKRVPSENGAGALDPVALTTLAVNLKGGQRWDEGSG